MSGVKRQKVFWDDGGETLKRFYGVDAVLASDYDRDTQALRDDYNEACTDAMQVAGKLQAVEAERDSLRAQVEVMRVALEVAALAMWNSEANMDNEAEAAEEALAGAAMQAKP